MKREQLWSSASRDREGRNARNFTEREAKRSPLNRHKISANSCEAKRRVGGISLPKHCDFYNRRSMIRDSTLLARSPKSPMTLCAFDEARRGAASPLDHSTRARNWRSTSRFTSGKRGGEEKRRGSTRGAIKCCSTREKKKTCRKELLVRGKRDSAMTNVSG